MWPEQPFEKQLHKALRNDKKFDRFKGEEYFAHYRQARSYLVNEVYPNIVAKEPNLTDHTSKHIQDVLKNIDIILKDRYKVIDNMDLYLLGLMVLFHDTGNIFGRKRHSEYDMIARVYDSLLKGDTRYIQERRVVVSSASAHSGVAKDGSRHTLKDVPSKDSIDGYPVNPREMAALLRFADELAEGPQRTSQFMQEHGLFNQSSKIFHEYANYAHVQIDRAGERIALTYNFPIKTSRKKLTSSEETSFRNLLAFTYHRVQKLDQERNYARHNSVHCTDFKRTTVAINIEKNGRRVLNLTECVLEDQVIPGQTHLDKIESQFESYSIDSIIQTLNQVV